MPNYITSLKNEPNPNQCQQKQQRRIPHQINIQQIPSKTKLSKGSFGKIYIAENTLTHELVTLKLEPKRISQSLLEATFHEHSKHFTLKTVCMLAIQMVRRIQWVYHKNIVHRVEEVNWNCEVCEC